MKNIFDKISLTRLSGISCFMCVDIHPGFVNFTVIKRKEPFYLIKKKLFLDYDIIFNEHQNRQSESDIKKTIRDICDKFKLNNVAIIAGINEYRSTLISIPAETEDTELWFDENKKKFLPENLNPHDFVYSYEKCREDENIKQYLLVIARNDLLEKVINCCKAEGLTFLGIFPVQFSILSYFSNYEQNMLYIDLCGNNIYFASRSETGNILFNNFYFELYKGSDEQDFNSSQLNIDNLKFCLEEIKQSLLLSGSNNVQNLSVYASFPQVHTEQITIALKNVFSIEELNPACSDIEPKQFSVLHTVNNIINDIDYGLNLYKNSSFAVERTKIEKNLTLRLSLTAGCIILMLLFVAYIAESFLHQKLGAGEEAFAEVKARSHRIEKLRLDNTHLKSNLNLLTELKYNKGGESLILSDISNIINERTCLTEIRLKNEKDYCMIEMSGISDSQQDVAEFIADLEKIKKFTGISLLYSSRNENSEDAGLSGKVTFKINSGYNADKN